MARRLPDRFRHRGCARRTRRPRCRGQRGVPRRDARAQFQPDGSSGRVGGPAPDHATYRSYATFSDPATTSFGSASDLASALRRAEAAHGHHEKRTGQRDANWPDWYAAYMVAEQAGEELSQ
jgi:hypothetical protein